MDVTAEDARSMKDGGATMDDRPPTFAPNITRDEMFWRSIRRPLPGADSNIERFMLAAATTWIEPGDFVVDLGANHGQHARVFAIRLGRSGSLLLVEADPSLAADLENGALHSSIKIEVVNAAVGDPDSREVVFYRHQTRDQEGSLFRREDGTTYQELRVPATSLDSLLAGRAVPSFVKIDVEGAEFSTLRGAAGLLRDHAPLVACEVSFDSEIESPESLNYTLLELIETLGEANWSLFALDGRRITGPDSGDPQFRMHYQCWLAKSGSRAEQFVTTIVPLLASAFAWASTETPPYPFHLDKHPAT
ncbi:FkbM family methyltransferase [Cellulomonas sp. KRMCY2]|uniref:FkbM family methyltransferase n=1 Tax=Cellulomonas sp. KRMCY2 TaxID=1304865 RepID=UPI0004B7EE72|nr:FkbM family methyltransferase [Cellulomonas sp. KRMCY2]